MKVSQDVCEFTVLEGVTDQQALMSGVQAKSAELVKQGAATFTFNWLAYNSRL